MSYPQKPVNSRSYQRINGRSVSGYQRINGRYSTNKWSRLYIEPVVTCIQDPVVEAAQTVDKRSLALTLDHESACSCNEIL
jgi:hypothetical protein